MKLLADALDAVARARAERGALGRTVSDAGGMVGHLRVDLVPERERERERERESETERERERE